MLMCSLLVTSKVSAQKTCDQDERLNKLLKVEWSDWYHSTEIPEDFYTKLYCRRCSLPGEITPSLQSEIYLRKKEEYFVYRIKVLNLSDKEIVNVNWSVEFLHPITRNVIAKHQFETATRIKPGRRKTLSMTSLLPPTPTIDARLIQNYEEQLDNERVTILSALPATKSVNNPIRRTINLIQVCF